MYYFNPESDAGAVHWHEFAAVHGRITQLLDWWSHVKSPSIRSEVHEWAINHVCLEIGKSARHITRLGLLKTHDELINKTFVSSFTFDKLHQHFSKEASIIVRVFEAVTKSSDRSDCFGEARKARGQMVTTSAIAVCLREHNLGNNLAQHMMGLYLYASGVQRQNFTVLSKLAICTSYTDLIRNEEVQSDTVAEINPSPAADLTTSTSEIPSSATTDTIPHAPTASMSSHTDTSPSETASPDASPIPANSKPKKRRLGLIRLLSNGLCVQARTVASVGLFGEVYDNINFMNRTAEQVIGRHDNQENGTCITIFKLWAARLKDMQASEKLAALQKEVDQKQPQSSFCIQPHKTEIYPVDAFNIDESSITGNAEADEAVVDILELHTRVQRFWERIRFIAGDQLSIARLRALENIRAGQEAGYEGFAWGIWIPELFHCKLADITEYAESEELSFEQIFADAEKILDRYANSSVVEELQQAREFAGGRSSGEGDMVFKNAVLFLRDALISREFTDAMQAGDSGHVVLVLKIWALSFRGNGHTKYAYEMLHLIHNIEVVKIVLNNWLVNTTGGKKCFLELDLLVQEHLNYWIKVFYKAHGSNMSWEWLSMITPCIDILRSLARTINSVLGSDQGNLHAETNLGSDIDTLMSSLTGWHVYTTIKGREVDEDDEIAADVTLVGLIALTTGTENPITEYEAAFTKLQRR
ncbi:hypothetical protein BT96DRAFT_933227 [Gymnopus androsaceus JB14]|uniref:DUF6589 domain-containing protein n=1 Tax=Gymnopus androsaceus JB14 TaxID=1447944 RepID=A0A6A4IEF5_9AGAR|nr:hypothetical protein BT96DRAFT_933227 [Gymnopus androsaceus JB14]